LREAELRNRVRSRCSGEQYDSDLGLYYLRARYYNPNTGRFMSRDPEAGHIKDPASLHKYLYAGGDPVNLIDPTGRNPLMELAGRLALVAAKQPAFYRALLACSAFGAALGVVLGYGFAGQDAPPAAVIGLASTAALCLVNLLVALVTP